MGIDDTELSISIQNEHLKNYIDDNVNPENPEFKPFFDGFKGENRKAWIKAVIGWTKIFPSDFDLDLPEERKRMYDKRIEVARTAGLIGESESLYYKSPKYRTLGTISKRIRHQAKTILEGTKKVKAIPGQAGNIRQKRQRLKPQRAF